MSYEEEIMSKDKYPSIFLPQMATIVYIFPNFQNCALCEKDGIFGQVTCLDLSRATENI